MYRETQGIQQIQLLLFPLKIYLFIFFVKFVFITEIMYYMVNKSAKKQTVIKLFNSLSSLGTSLSQFSTITNLSGEI